ncbi:MAG: diphosphate--fructose-6-phosphate 1-phosphotransferase [Elusimicrobia bacterium]|jgi:pyrophosphate--fructose-6-phosphate 1-phosphotransferase|nr:diphosphate--fructose-6-phosphate 1-phosphotransferase [Elusimicrobiota bacterium]MBK7208043.1 diphosphate--fructose-6-phosphate 1-phosphotransferase [Elusimicrobiota bacterium]MBK7544821.1 diphosphate--fructose-6-phosphate 1-phosphotransferase [Elusimicrobiota bacterium]MBK7574333.1 diphosphate--fructose-6-phosphate 1-phosphotransferase [Elusimicrobiota bacterium]MBK7688303.1 diphosphate--fructose-6-phosphate 1-phosphotransferase [Elusimicrobiota bacterium]
MSPISPLQKERLKFKPTLPAVFKAGPGTVRPQGGKVPRSVTDGEALRAVFPKTFGLPVVSFGKGKNPGATKKAVRVGVVLSGGQAPGGHNVLAGLLDGLKKANAKNKLFGFLGGPSGILDNKVLELTPAVLAAYRNTGGFDLIQSGRTKIETPEQFAAAKKNIAANKLDALVVVGGDDSNTNAALLAEYFKTEGLPASVVGVPKTIDGDLKNERIETSFGFDTATKIYSELVGNIARDILSARKYWHFVRLMGRSASHITLEVALQTHPNIALIGEEVLARKQTLGEVVDGIAGVIMARAAEKKNYGLVLIPEGLIEFIPEMRRLISELNDALPQAENAASFAEKREIVRKMLSGETAALLTSLPEALQIQLMLDRDPHGNVTVSQIETEKLLVEMVKTRLSEMKKTGGDGGKFSAITHFFGYEGRCGAPSNFDATYCYALGFNAAVLALNGLTGYLSSIQNLTKPAGQWKAGGVPLTMMMNMERRKGKDKPVIQKALVVLNGRPFGALAAARAAWAKNDDYVFPGPIQYFGPAAVTDVPTQTLLLESR